MKTPIASLNREQLALALAKALGLSVSYCGGSPLRKGKILSVILEGGNEFVLDWNQCGPLLQDILSNMYGDEVLALVDEIIAGKGLESIARAYLTMKYPEGIEIGDCV